MFLPAYTYQGVEAIKFFHINEFCYAFIQKQKQELNILLKSIAYFWAWIRDKNCFSSSCAFPAPILLIQTYTYFVLLRQFKNSAIWQILSTDICDNFQVFVLWYISKLYSTPIFIVNSYLHSVSTTDCGKYCSIAIFQVIYLEPLCMVQFVYLVQSDIYSILNTQYSILY